MAYPYGGPSVQGQTLELHVVGCYNLSDKEWFTKQDPYVVIEYSGQKFRTRTDTDGGKNPSFNETFKIALIEGLREINANVWNSNTLERDDYIGSAKILLNKVIDTGYDDTQWPLSNSRTRKSSGSLKLIMHYAGSAKTKPGKYEGSSYTQASPSMHYGQPVPAYPQSPVSAYPQSPVSAYPQSPASAYPQSAVPAYPQSPASAYPQSAASAYPQSPASAYPQSAASAYGQSVTPYPPPAGYGAPPMAAQAYRPTYPGATPSTPAYPPPSPTQPPYYPQASAPPHYGSGPPTYPPPPGYPSAGGYPQNRPY